MRILQHTKEDEAKYLEFIQKHDRSNFQQSLEWGNIKTSWIKEVVVSEDNNGNIVGSLCIWIRKIPIFGNIMYSARGPICDIHSKEVLKDLVEIQILVVFHLKSFYYHLLFEIQHLWLYF